jgi:hypothetical protein
LASGGDGTAALAPAAPAAFALSGGAPEAAWPPSASIGHRLRALQKPYRRVQARAGLLRPPASGSHLVCQASEPQVFQQRTYVSRWQPWWRKRM